MKSGNARKMIDENKIIYKKINILRDISGWERHDWV